MSDSFDFAELFTDFRDEGRDQLALLDAALGALERRDAAGAEAGRAELLRGLHTLKGNAGMLGLRPLQELVHGMETLLKSPTEALFGVAGAMQEAASALRWAVEHAGTPGQDEALAALTALRLPQPGGVPDTRSAASGERAGDVAWPADPSSPQDAMPKTAAPPLAGATELPESRVPHPPAGPQPSATEDPAASLGPAGAASPESHPDPTSAGPSAGPASPEPDEPGTGDGGSASPASAPADPAAAGAAALSASPAPPGGPDETGRAPSAEAPAERRAEVPQAGDLREEVLRVPFARLDAMLHQVGELAAAAAGLEAWLAASRMELDAAGLRRSATERVEALGAAVEATGRLARQLRTVPVARVFGRFPPLVGDLARAQGKQVRVVLEGEQTELDKSTADVILDPLLHLVRNAVDHGVETPAAREAAGKPPAATLWLRAVPEGEMVRIEVEDDGRGLDLEAMLRRARELGWAGPAEVPPPAELADLVFRPGFSTRTDVTELSGRGIGLDVVRSTVARLRGTVEVERGDEGGARFVLRLPLTVALVPVLFLESAGQVLAIAASDVEEATRVGAVACVGPAEVVDVRGEALAVIRPSRLFGWEAGAEPRLAVVVRRGARSAAILADRLLEQRPATIRPLPAALGSPRGVSGATLDADGRVVLLLDAGEMMQLNVDLYREGARAQ